jgi:uncharacterized protein (DUF433 family)
MIVNVVETSVLFFKFTYNMVAFQFEQYGIAIDPEIRFGKPCVKGTRIAVSDILQWLASGMSKDDIIDDFPELSIASIHGALSFAARRDDISRIIAA